MSTRTPMTKLPRIAALALAMVLIAAGCGDDGDATPKNVTKTSIDAEASQFADKTGEATLAISIRGNQFLPPYVIVSAGTKITWTVEDDATHNVLPIDDGAFAKSDDLRQGDTYSLTFTEVGDYGDYGYYCSHHGSKGGGQRGGVRVVAKK